MTSAECLIIVKQIEKELAEEKAGWVKLYEENILLEQRLLIESDRNDCLNNDITKLRRRVNELEENIR